MRKKSLAHSHSFTIQFGNCIANVSPFFVISFLVMAAGGYVVLLHSKAGGSSLEGVARQTDERKTPYLSQVQPVHTQNPAKPKYVSPSLEQNEIAPQPKQETKQEKPSETISISLVVSENHYTVAVPFKSSVYDAMRIVQNTVSFHFSGRDFPGLGFFIEEINGVKNDYQKGIYWIYYVNNKKANLGVSSYLLQAGDVISWKYEADEN